MYSSKTESVTGGHMVGFEHSLHNILIHKEFVFVLM